LLRISDTVEGATPALSATSRMVDMVQTRFKLCLFEAPHTVGDDA
jgi:hypothetical protein